ncbi:hypothetical protein [Staphylococcus shinii]|uniref:hypothetical protein n=1 Tax=Staphylococcus shinii TaxID=2912228 RepID=UPI003F56157F
MKALIKLESKDFYEGQKVGVIELENKLKYDVYQDLDVGLKYYSLENEWIVFKNILKEEEFSKVREEINKLLFTNREKSQIIVKVLN